jgi:hypothetical protein
LGAGFYKIRLASKSKGGGKSGGFRIVTYYIEQKGDAETVYLITIYNKSEESSIDKKELLKILEKGTNLNKTPESHKIIGLVSMTFP